MSQTKKTQCHFPSAKIKKIIQENQQIGKLCNTVPFLVQKSLEIFLNDILDNVEQIAKGQDITKLTPPILKRALENSKYDFMKESLAQIEDLETGPKKRKSKASIVNLESEEQQKQKVQTVGRKKRKNNNATD